MELVPVQGPVSVKVQVMVLVMALAQVMVLVMALAQVGLARAPAQVGLVQVGVE